MSHIFMLFYQNELSGVMIPSDFYIDVVVFTLLNSILLITIQIEMDRLYYYSKTTLHSSVDIIYQCIHL